MTNSNLLRLPLPLLDRRRGIHAGLTGTGVTVLALLCRWRVEEALTLALLIAMLLDLWRLLRRVVELNAEQSQQLFGGEQPQRARLLRRTILMAFIAVVVLAICVHESKERSGVLPSQLRITLFFAALFTTWLELHLAFAFYYAKAYFSGNRPHSEASTTEQIFIFPGTDQPVFSDFLYVSYAVALTFAMSDVDAEDSSVRRVVLLQAIVSFLFYTTIFSVVTNLMVS